MTSQYIKKVAIVGAGGQQGKYIVTELLKTGKHNITAITRADSQAALPDGVKAAPVDYDDPSTIVAALKGQDILVITLAVTAPPDTQAKLINAAAEAGVQWVMPNEWGYDYASEALAKETFIGMPILATRKMIEETGKLNWVGIACGFWYEYSLGASELCFGFNHRKKEVTFYDDGNTKVDTSTLAQAGRAVASLLSLPVESSSGPALSNWKNKIVKIHSFFISQKEMFESVKRVTNTTDKDWTIKYEDVKERYQSGVKTFDGGKGSRRGFGQLLYARAFYSHDGGDFSSKGGLANKTLGLPEEDLDEATKLGVEKGLTTDLFGDNA